MKTSEFIKQVEELGYVTDKDSWYVYVRNKRFTVAMVSETRVNAIEANLRHADIPNKLFDLIVEYARTPIEEREEQPKYYWKAKGLNGLIDENYRYLNYVDGERPTLNTKVEEEKHQTQFTKKEFKEICEKHNITVEFEKEELDELGFIVDKCKP